MAVEFHSVEDMIRDRNTQVPRSCTLLIVQIIIGTSVPFLTLFGMEYHGECPFCDILFGLYLLYTVLCGVVGTPLFESPSNTSCAKQEIQPKPVSRPTVSIHVGSHPFRSTEIQVPILSRRERMRLWMRRRMPFQPQGR